MSVLWPYHLKSVGSSVALWSSVPLNKVSHTCLKRHEGEYMTEFYFPVSPKSQTSHSGNPPTIRFLKHVVSHVTDQCWTVRNFSRCHFKYIQSLVCDWLIKTLKYCGEVAVASAAEKTTAVWTMRDTMIRWWIRQRECESGWKSPAYCCCCLFSCTCHHDGEGKIS